MYCFLKGCARWPCLTNARYHYDNELFKLSDLGVARDERLRRYLDDQYGDARMSAVLNEKARANFAAAARAARADPLLRALRKLPGYKNIEEVNRGGLSECLAPPDERGAVGDMRQVTALVRLARVRLVRLRRQPSGQPR